MMICRQYLVSGRVQGVFYRATARDVGERCGLTGWVKNLPDGRVEALAIGDEHAIAQFEQWLSVGPDMAQVMSVDKKAVDIIPDLNGFKIRY